MLETNYAQNHKPGKCRPGLLAALCGAMLLGLTACSSECDSEQEDCSEINSVGAETEPTTVGPQTGSSNGGGEDAVFTLADVNHVIVVTGQSNVEASGTAFDEYLDRPDPRVFAYTDAGWQVADLHQVWDENAHPGNHALTDPNNSPNNNFTFHFSKSLAETDPTAVAAFIVLAAPGEGIANWDFESPFYLKMRDKITEALAQLPNKDTIDVMLWHQGESDAQYEGTSDTDATGFSDENSYEYTNYYPIKLRQVIANFRSESWAHSGLPFICGETRVGFRVNRRLLELNDDDDPNTACVFSTDLPFLASDPSGAHFSAEGLRQLGYRYLQAYLEMINR